MMPRVATLIAALAALAACAREPTERQLLDALAAVESSRGATSANVYQLRRIYVDDCNRIAARAGDARRWTYADRLDKSRAESMMRLYWAFYAGPGATAERRARIHNGGPDGAAKRATDAYWRRVQRELRRNGGAR